MVYLCSFIVLLCTMRVFSQTGLSFTACKLHDMKCFNTLNNDFTEKTYKGIPELNIKPIDPLFVPSLVIKFNNEDETILHFVNLTISGLKHQDLLDFEMNMKKQRVIMKTQVNIYIFGYLKIIFTRTSKSFTGDFTMNGTAVATLRTSYNLVVDEKGIQHFDIDPKRKTCRAFDNIKVALSSELQNAVTEDKKLFNNNIRRVFCKIVEKAFASVVQNLRTAAKFLPTSSFIKDLN